MATATKMLSALALMLAASSSVDAFGSRIFTGSAKNKACSSLIPQHAGISRMPVSSAFSLEATKDPASDTVFVTLTGTRPFKGFIIQSNGVGGSFDQGNLHQNAGCDQPTIRHRNPAGKTRVTGVWTCSQPCQGGTLSFEGTVVEEYTTFYQLPTQFVTV